MPSSNTLTPVPLVCIFLLPSPSLFSKHFLLLLGLSLHLLSFPAGLGRRCKVAAQDQAGAQTEPIRPAPLSPFSLSICSGDRGCVAACNQCLTKSKRQLQRKYRSGEADAFCSVVWGLLFQLPCNWIAAVTLSILGAWTGSGQKTNCKAGLLDRMPVPVGWSCSIHWGY